MLTQSQREQEPNPFEQSFSTIPTRFSFEDDSRFIHPLHNTMEKCQPLTYDTHSTNRDSFSSVSDNQTTSEDSSDYLYTLEHKRHSSHESSVPYHGQTKTPANQRKRSKSTKLPEDEEKRKNFLERNRLAALKCRQRKKQWLSNLQTRVEYLTNDNEQLQMEADALRKEIMDLKTLLITHKDCPQYNHAMVQRPMTTAPPSFAYPVQHYPHPSLYPPSSSMA